MRNASVIRYTYGPKCPWSTSISGAIKPVGHPTWWSFNRGGLAVDRIEGDPEVHEICSRCLLKPKTELNLSTYHEYLIHTAFLTTKPHHDSGVCVGLLFRRYSLLITRWKSLQRHQSSSLDVMLISRQQWPRNLEWHTTTSGLYRLGVVTNWSFTTIVLGGSGVRTSDIFDDRSLFH